MPINLGCQRNQQQPAGQNCPKNPSGLLSVTIFKQPRLPGDRQHPGSRMVLMQDLAQGAGGGTGTWKTHQGPAFPLSIHAALSQCPELNPPSSPQESMDGSGMSQPRPAVRLSQCLYGDQPCPKGTPACRARVPLGLGTGRSQSSGVSASPASGLTRGRLGRVRGKRCSGCPGWGEQAGW